jgi:site-specific DNA recombinase
MRAAIYARVSTQRQVLDQTIEQQLERLMNYVQQQGWELQQQNVFRDDGYSGASLNRPGLDQLRDQAAAREIDCIGVTTPDRLARNYVHQMLLLEELEACGCRIEFLDRPISQDPHDQLLLQIRGAVAEYERTLIADRMRRGRQAKYKAGILLPWTRPLFGYQLDPDTPRDPTKVTINEAEASIVREMFAYYRQENTSLYGVVQHLHEIGIPAPRGGKNWSTMTVRGILSNPSYTGKVYVGRMHFVKPRMRRSATQPVGKRGESHVKVPQAEWIPAATIPAIIENEVFEQIQVKLSHNQQASQRNNKAHEYLLRALVSCGLCNLSCTARQLNPGYTYYVCRAKTDMSCIRLHQRCMSRYIPAGQLDELVWNDLCQILTHPEIITAAIQRAQGGCWLPQELQARRENLRRGQVAWQTQLDRLTEAYLNGIIPLDEYQRRRTDLEKKRQGLEDLEKQLDHQVDRTNELVGLSASIEHFCQRIQLGLENATFEQKRKLVELLIDRVVVKNSDVEIRYVIPTSSASERVRFCHLHKDYFNPHPATIISQGHAQIRQIGGQAPRLFLADFPIDQQVGWIDLLGCQFASPEPDTLTGPLDETAEGLPTLLRVEKNPAVAFLAQDIEPSPLIELTQDCHSTKFTVSYQENGRFGGDQLANIGQQGQLLISATVPADVFDPSPGNGNGSFSVGQTDDQQLMSKSDLSTIHDQTDLSRMSKLPLQPFPGDGFVPGPDPYGWVSQQSTKAPVYTQQLCRTGNLSGNPAQTDRTALKDPDDQPDKVASLSNALIGAQVLNSLKPGMIEMVGRHEVPPVKEFCGKNYFNRIVSADQLFCC